MYAIPSKHIASSVGVFELGSEVFSGPGESWDLRKIHSLPHDEWGFPALAKGRKAGENLPNFSFSLPCGSRINGLKSHPELNLLWRSPWDGVVHLSFSFLTWELLMNVQASPSHSCLFLR